MSRAYRYRFDAQTGLYDGLVYASEDGIFPENCTEVEPIYRFGFRSVWDGSFWKLVSREDFWKQVSAVDKIADYDQWTVKEVRFLGDQCARDFEVIRIFMQGLDDQARDAFENVAETLEFLKLDLVELSRRIDRRDQQIAACMKSDFSTLFSKLDRIESNSKISFWTILANTWCTFRQWLKD